MSVCRCLAYSILVWLAGSFLGQLLFESSDRTLIQLQTIIHILQTLNLENNPTKQRLDFSGVMNSVSSLIINKSDAELVCGGLKPDVIKRAGMKQISRSPSTEGERHVAGEWTAPD